MAVIAGRIIDQGIVWGAGVFGQAVGTWLGGRGSSGGSTECVCKFEGGCVDAGLVALLQRQLDGCGPENLARPAPVVAEECKWGARDWVFVIAIAFVAFFVGCLGQEFGLSFRPCKRRSDSVVITKCQHAAESHLQIEYASSAGETRKGPRLLRSGR